MGLQKKVYLVGGFGGYLNFGDIIQLKNIIDFHESNTSFKPIIIILASSLTSKDSAKKLKQWFQGVPSIFVSDTPIEPDFGLVPMYKTRASDSLHLYGGGYLNRFWGEYTLGLVESFISDFHIGSFQISGIQIDRSVVSGLRKLFRRLRPSIVGLRDHESVEIMQRAFPDLNIKYSFDDSFEVFSAWARQASQTQKLGRLKKRINLAQKSFVVHLNISSYASADKKALVKKIRKAAEGHGTHLAHVVQAYDDPREELLDSLRTITVLGPDFPVDQYFVTNLAAKSLALDMSTNSFPKLDTSLLCADFAISSSYHVALFMMVLGVPTHLIAQNDFYKQKASGLGLESNYEAFLRAPQGRNLRAEKEAREHWNNALKDIFNQNKATKRKIIAITPN